MNILPLSFIISDSIKFQPPHSKKRSNCYLQRRKNISAIKFEDTGLVKIIIHHIYPQTTQALLLLDIKGIFVNIYMHCKSLTRHTFCK